MARNEQYTEYFCLWKLTRADESFKNEHCLKFNFKFALPQFKTLFTPQNSLLKSTNHKTASVRRNFVN